MKIELQEPFNSLWRNGYIVTNPENRRNVCLVNDATDRTTISYARYLMCVKLGYILSDEFEVDHKDNDKTNDDVDNLQVLTKAQNKLKQELYYVENVQVFYGYECAACGHRFIITERIRNMKLNQTTTGLAFCSRRCAGQANSLKEYLIE